MKPYMLKLKGVKSRNTEDLEIKIYGDNMQHAFNWAWSFFQQGEFKEPYYASGVGEYTGTEKYIPNASELQHLKGKYKVYTTSISRAVN